MIFVIALSIYTAGLIVLMLYLNRVLNQEDRLVNGPPDKKLTLTEPANRLFEVQYRWHFLGITGIDSCIIEAPNKADAIYTLKALLENWDFSHEQKRTYSRFRVHEIKHPH